ncbi:MAG: catabolite control protein A, partial [Lachnospiraceae bacterium]|nr:catabolite control protein A [Lachnospiraceae bacterium]
ASQTMVKNQDGESILLLEIVNNTEETVEVSTTDIELNELRVCDSTWSRDMINPGKTAIMDIDLSSVLEPEYWTVYGITEVNNVALKISFTNEDDEEFSEPAYLSIDISGTGATFSMEGTEIYNNNGLRLISKGIYADPSEYSDNLHLLLVAENTSGQTLVLHNVYDSLSLNDYMASYSFYTTTIEDDVCVMVDILLWGDDLEDINISGPSDIQSVEFSLTIRDEDYTEIDEASIAFTIE